MAWPSKLTDVICCNFDRKYLHIIKLAIKNKQVKWLESAMFAESCIARFAWAGCVWELSEFSETVTDITLVSGMIDPEVLTIEVLRC